MLTKEELWHYFQNDTFAVTAGIVPEVIGEDCVVCSMPIDVRHQNADGAVMGGAIFTLGDFAFALFANRSGVGTVTLSANIAYLGKAKGTKLIATVRPIKEGRSVVNATITVEDELGTPVAHMTASGFRKQ